MNGNSKSEHEFVKRVAKIVEANLSNEQFEYSHPDKNENGRIG